MKRRSRTNRHHRVPRSQGGDESPSNLVPVDIELHHSYHALFDNRTVEGVAKQLQAYFPHFTFRVQLRKNRLISTVKISRRVWTDDSAPKFGIRKLAAWLSLFKSEPVDTDPRIAAAILNDVWIDPGRLIIAQERSVKEAYYWKRRARRESRNFEREMLRAA